MAQKTSPQRAASGRVTVDAVVAELRGALRALRCGTTERIIRQGVSMTQIHVLWLLEHHGELPMSRLAELLAVSPSNSSGLIDRMGEHGLVERRRVADDRRVVMVGIASEGLRVLRELEEVHHDRLRRALDRLAPQDLARVHGAFADFRSAIEADLDPACHRHALDPAALAAEVPPAPTAPSTAATTAPVVS
jgi:DNA-binding MarR family transcriptional regulator